jgi:uncharacterized protein with NRDE domain
MCLVVVALEVSERYPLIFCANRDERHARPTAPAAWWREDSRVLGGRDLVAGGSWLAVDRAGRLAAVTNLRALDATAAPRSRGELVAAFVTDTISLDTYSAALERTSADYGPFSLLLLDGADLRYVSNRAPGARLGPGVHSLSNAAYGVDWPKVRSARAGVQALLGVAEPVDALLALLAERGAAPSDEHFRTAHFIAGTTYGTRSSTVVLVDRDRTATFVERSFDGDGRVTGEVRETFALDAAR